MSLCQVIEVKDLLHHQKSNLPIQQIDSGQSMVC